MDVNRLSDGLRIDYPIEEELLAAVESALEWFEAWDRHAPSGSAFGGEYAVMRRLRLAIRLAREDV